MRCTYLLFIVQNCDGLRLQLFLGVGIINGNSIGGGINMYMKCNAFTTQSYTFAWNEVIFVLWWDKEGESDSWRDWNERKFNLYVHKVHYGIEAGAWCLNDEYCPKVDRSSVDNSWLKVALMTYWKAEKGWSHFPTLLQYHRYLRMLEHTSLHLSLCLCERNNH